LSSYHSKIQFCLQLRNIQGISAVSSKQIRSGTRKRTAPLPQQISPDRVVTYKALELVTYKVLKIAHSELIRAA